MQLTEFRIGNYLHDREGRLCKVTSLIYDRFVVDGVKAPAIDGPITALPHSPVELTEEWFLKFGFEKKFNRDGAYWSFNNLEVGDLQPEYFVPFNIQNKKSIYIKTVHQLQNIYFILTNKELTYTP